MYFKTLCLGGIGPLLGNTSFKASPKSTRAGDATSLGLEIVEGHDSDFRSSPSGLGSSSGGPPSPLFVFAIFSGRLISGLLIEEVVLHDLLDALLISISSLSA